MPRSSPTSGRWSHRRRGRGDRGAALVEFALIAMPLFLILFGTIEFGWAFFQLNDIRHGAREGIRLVAVDADPTPDYTGADMDSQGERLLQAACERMDQSDGVWIQITLTDLDGRPRTGCTPSTSATTPSSSPSASSTSSPTCSPRSSTRWS